MSWYRQLKFASIKLLHGTSSNFTQFDLLFAGQRDWSDDGIGVYLTPNATLAKSYAKNAVESRGGRPIVYLVEANVSNLANMDDTDLLSMISSNTGAPFPKELEPGKNQSRPEEESRNITEFLIASGYDGVVARNGNEYVIFDPSKINMLKSFDINNENDNMPYWLNGS